MNDSRPLPQTRTIVVANQKGGVGKTTTVTNLAAALHELGHSVLLVDLDPQGALSASFGVDPTRRDPSIWTALRGDTEELPPIAVRVRPRLFLLPASSRLPEGPHEEADVSPPSADRLRRLLAGDQVPFDFVVIDTPPTLGPLTLNALVAADELLVPVQCQYLAMRGVKGLLAKVHEVRTGPNPRLQLLGVLATQYRPGSRLSEEVLAELRSVFRHKVFPVAIDDDEVVAEAPLDRQTLLEYRPASRAADAYRQVAQEVVRARG